MIAIIAILAAMLLPALSKARAKAREITCTNQQRSYGQQMALYADDYNGMIMMLFQRPTKDFTTFSYWGKINGYMSTVGLTYRELRCPCAVIDFSQTEKNKVGQTYGVPESNQMVPKGCYVTLDAPSGGYGGFGIMPEKIASPTTVIMICDNLQSGTQTNCHDFGYGVRWNGFANFPYEWHSGKRVNCTFFDGHAAAVSDQELKDSADQAESKKTPYKIYRNGDMATVVEY